MTHTQGLSRVYNPIDIPISTPIYMNTPIYIDTPVYIPSYIPIYNILLEMQSAVCVHVPRGPKEPKNR